MSGYESGPGAKWVASQRVPMSETGRRVADLLDWVFSGIYHIEDSVRRAQWDDERFVTITLHEGLSTFDSNMLTRLVVGAHDRCIRVSVVPASPRYLRLYFHPRVGREGRFFERHPTMEEALATMRRLEAVGV